jgi:hypothetical protein
MNKLFIKKLNEELVDEVIVCDIVARKNNCPIVY